MLQFSLQKLDTLVDEYLSLLAISGFSESGKRRQHNVLISKQVIKDIGMLNSSLFLSVGQYASGAYLISQNNRLGKMQPRES